MFPLQDSIPSRTPPIVTVALIAANVFVFLLQASLTPAALEQVIHLFGIVPARYSHPEWAEWIGFPADDYWPFLTSQFLHGGWLHLLANVWTLWIFGDNVEDRLGHGRFLAFYLACGVAAGVAHGVVNPTSTVPAIGASGAISGVMGAYFVSFPRSRIILLVPILFYPLFFEVPAVFYLALWFLMQLSSGTVALAQSASASGVAFWAHVGGFAAGILFLFPFLLGRGRRALARDEYGIDAGWGGRRR
jgi:membrane associated rhomboid family serine protease